MVLFLKFFLSGKRAEKQGKISSYNPRNVQRFLVKEKIYKILTIPLLVTLRHRVAP